MSHDFTLVIEAATSVGADPHQTAPQVTNPVPSRAQLRLLDANDNYLASNQFDLDQFSLSERHALFDLRHFVAVYHTDAEELAAMAATGVLIAEKVLGTEIFTHLYASRAERTLHIRLPACVGEPTADAFHAALGRIPWEIARPSAAKPPLSEMALRVLINHHMAQPASNALPLPNAPDEVLRVLFVFAEAQGSMPLGMRQERRALQALFREKIYPKRQILADFLAHGITRAQLQQQWREQGGYHIVHWSGHGGQNLLELAKPGGTADYLSGEDLLECFLQAGGTLPRLCFLSACHSGDSVQVTSWDDFLHGNTRRQTDGKAEASHATGQPRSRDIDFTQQPALTGSAHALLYGGVPSVVAMRYAVGDDYARDLALAFYQALLADAKPKSIATALAHARALVHTPAPGQARALAQARYSPCDHATPMLLGADQTNLARQAGRSSACQTLRRCLPGLSEFAVQSNFVGRTWQLAALGSEFIEGQQPVALITGLGGMGKTSLTAELIDIWQARFDWVLLFQAKPELRLELFLTELHQHLDGELKVYHQHIKQHPADAIYLDPNTFTNKTKRQQRMADNLLRAMEDEAILLVLDNFETNLKGQAQVGSTLWAAKDPDWDLFLRRLTQGLSSPTRSRLLLTCRRPLAALAAQNAPGTPTMPSTPGTSAHNAPHNWPHWLHWLQLGPLPAAEARLYLRQHPQLSHMLYGSDEAEQILAQRVLQASRFHPLLLDRLARLCSQPAHRPQLLQALQTLEHSRDYAQLPKLFASHGADPGELAYLQNALEQSIDDLIGHLSADAARLLWLAALSNEAVSRGLLQAVWTLTAQEPEPEAEPAQQPDLAALLADLVSVGLLHQQSAGPDDEQPDYTCHELVRERSLKQGEMLPQAAPEPVWQAYARCLSAEFKDLRHKNMAAALQAGSRAVVYCVQAQAYAQLNQFASGVVTSSNDVRLLQGLIPHLQAAANAAPAGPNRWRCLGTLAEALRNGGQVAASLAFYQQAASQAQAVAVADQQQAAWEDYAVSSHNWALALCACGQLASARQRLVESAEAKRQAGSPAIAVINTELEALRISIMQGEVDAALPEIETRLAQVSHWWQQQQAGHAVPEAPDAIYLARAFLSALDIAREAAYAKADWPAALAQLETMLKVEQALQRPVQDMAVTRFNRATVLTQLQRFKEAQNELEACLALFQANPVNSASVLSSLANLFGQQGDWQQAIQQARRALALRATLPNPQERAISHNNLAKYLEKSGQSQAQAESRCHHLAALIYRLCAGLQQHLKDSRHNYANHFRAAHAAQSNLAIPRISELFSTPGFHPLATWLEQWLAQEQTTLPQLQERVDAWLAQVAQETHEALADSAPPE